MSQANTYIMNVYFTKVSNVNDTNNDDEKQMSTIYSENSPPLLTWQEGRKDQHESTTSPTAVQTALQS